MSEKSEEPTQQKLEKAREEGQGPKSSEVASVMAFASVLVTLMAMSDWMADRLKAIASTLLLAVSSPLHEQWLSGLAMQVLILTLTLTLPLAAAMVAGACIGMLMQVGIQITFKPIEPKFDAINPANGIKKVISLKSLLEGLQMLLRAIVIVALVWYLIRAALPLITGVVYQEPGHIAASWWLLVVRLLLATLLTYILMGPLDYALQRWQFMKGQRMSKDEVKREYKESEGDPMIKSARRGLAKELINDPPQRKTHAGKPRVIVANPTHCAVALAWQPGMLPTVVARGEDRSAVALREAAQAQGIAVFTNRSLARELIKLPLGGVIQEDLFDAVASILRCIVSIEALGQKTEAA